MRNLNFDGYYQILLQLLIHRTILNGIKDGLKSDPQSYQTMNLLIIRSVFHKAMRLPTESTSGVILEFLYSYLPIFSRFFFEPCRKPPRGLHGGLLEGFLRASWGLPLELPRGLLKNSH
jgi:hypothetical protein